MILKHHEYSPRASLKRKKKKSILNSLKTNKLIYTATIRRNKLSKNFTSLHRAIFSPSSTRSSTKKHNPRMFESVEVGLIKLTKNDQKCAFLILRDQRRETRRNEARRERDGKKADRGEKFSILKITFLRLSRSQPRISHLVVSTRRGERGREPVK